MDVLMAPKADTWGKSISAPSSWNPRFRQAGTPDPPSAVVSGWESEDHQERVLQNQETGEAAEPSEPRPKLRGPCRPRSVNSRPAGLGLLCQNRSEPNGLACLLAGRCCECPFTGRFVPVKLGLSFPISFWAVSPQGAGRERSTHKRRCQFPLRYSTVSTERGCP